MTTITPTHKEKLQTLIKSLRKDIKRKFNVMGSCYDWCVGDVGKLQLRFILNDDVRKFPIEPLGSLVKEEKEGEELKKLWDGEEEFNKSVEMVLTAIEKISKLKYENCHKVLGVVKFRLLECLIIIDERTIATTS